MEGGRNLMARDDFKNLGFTESSTTIVAKKAPEGEEGKKGELRW